MNRLMLFSNHNDAVKKNLIENGHFGIVDKKRNEIVDLGDSVNVIILNRRYRALEVKPVGVYSYFSGDDMQRIMMSQGKGKYFGPEYLLWIDGQACTFLLGNQTLRWHDDVLKASIGDAVVLKSKEIVNKNRQWFDIDILEGKFNTTASEQMYEANEEFNHPPEAFLELLDVGTNA